MVNTERYSAIAQQLAESNVTLVAVSKMKPAADIQSLYDLGQRDFGENYVQELVDKQAQLPTDIRWHFIGHLQTNKVKHIAPFVHLVHGVDSQRLLAELSRQAVKAGRVIDVLLQVHIAQEETKFGLDEEELVAALDTAPALPGVAVLGLMGMASFSENKEQVRGEFRRLKQLRDAHADRAGSGLPILSMGMSDDHVIAIEEGSTMVRVGSLLFGRR
ncbi:MAG: YggS family pyridoxal phosphate-dependent enzyme [Flaviaesturariibacter sp.]|nr:YggS family pyridoxal phosphate-dependent enzyme [Flaviaesturariibacter sp.]